MLDDKTLKWLEEREERFDVHGVYSASTWIASFYMAHALTPDFEDAAKFEARVAIKLASGLCEGCSDFGVFPKCPVTIFSFPNWEWCKLRHARLTVESEMELEHG